MKDKKYLAKVAQLPCAICGIRPVQVHHPRTGVGFGKKSSDRDTIPLCFDHHLGDDGIHGLGRKAFESLYGVTETELTLETRKLVERIDENERI